jgi:transposase
MKSEIEVQELAINDYISCNQSLTEVAKKYGYSGGWLLKQLKSRNIDRRGNSEWKLSKEKELKACKDYSNGVLVKDIAKKYFVSRRTITEWLKRNGITPLTNSQRLGVTDDMKKIARDLYINKRMNCVDISKVINVSCRSILDWVKDVKRTMSEINCEMALQGKKKNRGIKGILNTKFGIIRHDSSYERDRIIQLCEDDNVSMITRCNYFIKYGDRNYNPDFVVKYKCGCVCIEEVKPMYMLNDATNKMKFESAKNFCITHNLLFKVITEKEIYGKWK